MTNDKILTSEILINLFNSCDILPDLCWISNENKTFYGSNYLIISKLNWFMLLLSYWWLYWLLI